MACSASTDRRSLSNTTSPRDVTCSAISWRRALRLTFINSPTLAQRVGLLRRPDRCEGRLIPGEGIRSTQGERYLDTVRNGPSSWPAYARYAHVPHLGR